jgi:aflatoxin B1 aldehyde reductase
MTFGWNQASSVVEDRVAAEMLQKYVQAGGAEVDTARIYSGGRTEEILGLAMSKIGILGQGVTLATKVAPSEAGGLSKVGIHRQLNASLSALQVDRVDVLYLHQPDPQTELTESLECIHELVQQGKVGALGLSNYSAIELSRCILLCQAKGWTPPTVLQGLYSPLNRMVEEELMPLCREHGVAFVAYNPLGGGLLSGKHRLDGEVAAGRFKDNPNYLLRFFTEPNFEAVARIRAACDAAGLRLVPATYAWLLQHSALDGGRGDGVLIGASSIQQLDENIAACFKPVALPEPVVNAFDEAWSTCKDGAFYYWRSYSKDQPGRETMNQGAAYNAKHGK